MWLNPIATARRGQAVVSRLFISYRRDDSAGYAGRLYDRLEREFGRDHLVMDVDAIPLGANFVKVLSDEVARCDLLLAIMGPGWLEARDEEGNRRLENPQDFVRIEIGTALKRGIPVIPILLEGTRIPKADQLPDDLKELPLRNGLNVRHVSFLDDLERLIRGLKREAKRRAEEAQRKAAEEAEAQETREWALVISSRDKKVIQNFLERWPHSQRAEAARARIGALEREAPEAEARRKAEEERKLQADAARARIAARWLLLGAVVIVVGVLAGLVSRQVGVPVPWRSQVSDAARGAQADAEVMQRKIAEAAAAEKAAAEKAAAEKATAEKAAAEKAAAEKAAAEKAAAEKAAAEKAAAEKAAAEKAAAEKAAAEKAAAEKAAAEKAARADDPALSVQPGSGQSFRDRLVNGQPCPMCPEMVVVPNGNFTMGSPLSEPQRGSEDQVLVSIAEPFAAGKYAVTRGEFAAFVVRGAKLVAV